jgi:hypothetical protein
MTEGSRGETERGTPDLTIHDPDDVIGGADAGGGGGSGERATGTPNTIYDLSSVLFHALEGGASYDTYIEDAEREGDQEIAAFFIQVRDEDAMRADEAQRLLAERTSIPGETSDTARGVAATEGVEPDLPPSTEPRAEGAPLGDPRREYAVTEMPDENLAPPGEGGVTPRSTEVAASPRPEPSDDFPGTEPVREDASTIRSGEVPPPEEIPLERAGEIPTAEEVPPPRTEDVPMAEEVPSGTPPQAPPGDVQRGTTSEPLRTEEPAGEQERQIEQEREDEGLVERLTNRARDKLTGEEEQRRNR